MEEPGKANWKISKLALDVPTWWLAYLAITEMIFCTENNTQLKNVSACAKSVTSCVIWGQMHYFQWDLRFQISVSSFKILKLSFLGCFYSQINV